MGAEPVRLSLCEENESVAIAYYNALAAFYSSEGCGFVIGPVGEIQRIGWSGVRGPGVWVDGGQGDLAVDSVRDGAAAGAAVVGSCGGDGDGVSTGAGRVDSGGVGLNGRVGLPRGPNYERNRASRLRKKIQQDARRFEEMRSQGRREAMGENWRSGAAPLGGSKERELHELRVERQILQERRKLDKLKSPSQIIEDAMRMVEFAERCAKRAGQSKVAGWAATLTESYAESLAKSTPDSVRSFEEVVSGRKHAELCASLAFSKVPLNDVELVALDRGVVTRSQLMAARLRVRRALVGADFERSDFPYKLTLGQLDAIRMVSCYANELGRGL